MAAAFWEGGPRRVYFIQPIGIPEGPVKIGCSRVPHLRRDTLDTWSPYPLDVVAQIIGGPKLEQRFHARFAEYHDRREWFRWSPELQAVIDAIIAGSFDIETLPEPRGLPKRARRQHAASDLRWNHPAHFQDKAA